jgi:hypothetical protein
MSGLDADAQKQSHVMKDNLIPPLPGLWRGRGNTSSCGVAQLCFILWRSEVGER